MNFYLTELCARFSKRAVYLTVIVLLTGFLFLGCGDPNTSINLNGTWSSDFDSYKIDTSAKKIEYVGNYKADIVNSPDYEVNNGILIVKFTWYWEIIYDEGWNVVSEEETTAYNEKFGAVYWKDLATNSVKMGDAYDTTTWEHAMYDTLEEAQMNFTIDKTGDYIGMWGSYTK
ncbi:MAG: hypothetical protein FWC06_04950 [Treponema sp.]|nr:hypothetical protein [Treponema sp.]